MRLSCTGSIQVDGEAIMVLIRRVDACVDGFGGKIWRKMFRSMSSSV